MASYLQSAVGHDKKIIVIGQNSVFLITAYLGILRSGNVFVPLDFSIEQGNFDYISNLTGCDLIFCDSNTLQKLQIGESIKIFTEREIQFIL